MEQLLTGLGLSTAAGLNAYIPMLMLGLLARFTDIVHLPAGWSWMENGWVILIIAVLLVRDGLLAATLPLLRSRGLTALPVTYIGKAATFALMSAFPLILLGQFDAMWSRVVGALGWGFLIWGIYMYLWSFVLYVLQVTKVLRELPRVTR